LNKNKIYLNGGSCPAGERLRKREIINGKWYHVYFDHNDKDLGHETFILKRKPMSDSCKTARKPYDLVVCGLLILAKIYFMDDIKIRSDGNLEDWQPAIDWVKEYYPEKIMELFLNDNLFK
jgi:hypothetical protein